jgi:acetyltransferase
MASSSAAAHAAQVEKSTRMAAPIVPSAAGYRSATRPPRRRAPHAPQRRAAPAGESLVTRDGRSLRIRPILPHDAAALRRAFARLTPEQVRSRFFYRMNELEEAVAERLCNPDPETSAAFVVTDADDAEIRGEARIHIDAVTESAEFAIAVDPAFIGQGLGRALMQRLLGECRRRGLVELWGDVLADNHAMLEFVRHLGLTPVFERGDESSALRVRFAIPAV